MPAHEPEYGKWFGIHPTDSTVSLRGYLRGGMKRWAGGLPYADKMDPGFDRKGSFELQGQVLIIAVIYFIRKWELFDVGYGEESDLLKHACQRASCVSPAGETKKADFVAETI
jgi:hypothetical protein